ncbi:kinesin-like protein KIF3C [Amia ocellicauda]|uniref:kinesin-like protein KIF3C n=1 Tax=Amia ocellicauda TaxID=2972642 RepID=UPI003464A325
MNIKGRTETKKNNLGNKSRTLNKSFQAVIRLCPQEQKSPVIGTEVKSSIQVKEPNRVVVDTGRGHQPHTLEFDAVWDESASQKDVYESTAQPLVGFVLQGYNGCVITYGSPASGKTYTLQGGSLTGKQRGIISRAAEDIFNSPEASNCKIRASFIHISNEKIYDLLDSQPAEVCRIHESEETVFLEGLREVEVTSAQALLQLYRRGMANRHTGVSKGEFASKSHTIFNIIVISTQFPGNDAQDGILTASRLTLVDLASSGRVPVRGAVSDGKRCLQTAHENPQEAKILKRSLTIFGNVIFALSSAGCQHVPYRESKLTRILRDCLGGNCLTSLIVTVSSTPSSATETLSALQFASRAMAMPNRPVRSSQLHCGSAQINNSKVTEKPQTSQGRQQTLPSVSDKKGLQIQTCLPPILSSPAPPARLLYRTQEALQWLEDSVDPREQKAFLPHLERATEGIPQTARAGRSRPVEERVGRVMWSRSSSMAGPPATQEPPRERQPPRPEPHPPRASTDRLPAEVLKALECPNCKKERKIREEYDKYIVQARRDKDALHQRLAELEAELRRGAEEREATSAVTRAEVTQPESEACFITSNTTSPVAWQIKRVPEQEEGVTELACLKTVVEKYRNTMSGMVSKTELLQLESENKQKQQQVDNLLVDMEEIQGQLERVRASERELTCRLHAERSHTAQDIEELRTQLLMHREREQQQLSTLQRQKDSILLELQDTKAELQSVRERVMLTSAEWKMEKVKSENVSLVEKVSALHKELRSRASPGYSEPPHVHTITTNTEMLLVSHHMSQQSAGGITAESTCCFNSCSGFHSSTTTYPGKPSTAPSMEDSDLLKNKDIYKQLKRERNLLLDVMVILYTRRWFVDDALPHVRRTLKKCGMRLEDMA